MSNSTNSTISTEQSSTLRAMYDDIDAAARAFLLEHPRTACPPTCHLCCTKAAPLVSAVELSLVEVALQALDVAVQAQVRERALAIRGDLEQGADDDFICPLLDGGRCLVYAARPYLCRSFGHSARTTELGQTLLYTCEILRPHLQHCEPPLHTFRIAALRQRLGPQAVVDSYLPIWLSTEPAQRVARQGAQGRTVVVAADAHRL